MRAFLTWVLGLAGFWGIIGMYLVKKAAEVAIGEEYDAWAPKVARVLVRTAGWVCPSKQEQWAADLYFMQQVEMNTGLVEALSCFLTSPFTTMAGLVARWKAHNSAKNVADEFLAEALTSAVASIPYQVEILGGAVADLRSVPVLDRRVLEKQIEGLATEPRPIGFETVIAEFCRIRVEGYRIVYEVNDEKRLVAITVVGWRRRLLRPRS